MGLPLSRSLSPLAASRRMPKSCVYAPAGVSIVSRYRFGFSGDQNSSPLVGNVTSPRPVPDETTLVPSEIEYEYGELPDTCTVNDARSAAVVT